MDNRILDDLARVAGGALGALSSLREEAEGQVRQQFERVLSRMDVVSREEHEAVRAMAAKAREEQELLSERIATLEATVASLSAALAAKPLPADHAPVVVAPSAVSAPIADPGAKPGDKAMDEADDAAGAKPSDVET